MTDLLDNMLTSTGRIHSFHNIHVSHTTPGVLYSRHRRRADRVSR